MTQQWANNSFVRINKNLIRLEQFSSALKKEDSSLWEEFSPFFEYFNTLPQYSIEDCQDLSTVLSDSSHQLSSLIEYIQKRQSVAKSCLNTKILRNIALDIKSSIHAHQSTDELDESYFA